MVTIDDARRDAQAVQVPHHEMQLVSSEIRWVNLEASTLSPDYKPEQQPIMCDFEIIKHDTSPARFYVTLVLAMENSRNIEGALAFNISSVAEFEFRPGAVAMPIPGDEEARWYLFSTAVSTAVGMTRGHLAHYLAPTAYRGYYLPMLNVQELIDKRYAPAALPEVPSTAPSEKPPRKTRTPRQ